MHYLKRRGFKLTLLDSIVDLINSDVSFNAEDIVLIVGSLALLRSASDEFWRFRSIVHLRKGTFEEPVWIDRRLRPPRKVLSSSFLDVLDKKDAMLSPFRSSNRGG